MGDAMEKHTTRVWEFDGYGSPEVLHLAQRELPRLSDEDVLVRITASAINPSDVKNVGGHFRTSLPRVPGRDYAGVIAGGDGIEGEEVYGSGPGFGVRQDGAHAEYIVIPASWISRKPRSLAPAQAASVGVPFVTAWTVLVTAGAIQRGETILITGVSGAVGSAATQIAHVHGARVIGADLSANNIAGADAMIDTREADLAQEVHRLTDGRGATLVFDTVGGALFEPALKSLARGGRQIAIASSPQVVSFNLVDFYHEEKRLIGVDTMALTGEEIADVMDHLRELFDDGTLKTSTVHTWPFERAVEAYEAVAKREPPGKQVLLMAP
jgi:NADPH:quinone reductase